MCLAGQPSAFLIKHLADTEWVIQGLFGDSLKHAMLQRFPASFRCSILMILCAFLVPLRLKRQMQIGRRQKRRFFLATGTILHGSL